ncbi:hypothetical protein Prubr_69910 [Polymorphospora rubra]|uniref:DUF1345 domain-containing protein n=1 Tax=Polymorphospora rubra TaxID=338584 RepID=A0A810NA69_9ACTN|nr:hypothetical protein Prubr_69910 [Polymorphospora rubra]
MTHLAVIASFGLVAGVVAALLDSPLPAPLIGWDVTAVVYLIWVWSAIWRMDAATTARLALREDPSRGVTDVLLLAACVASLVAVGFVLVDASARDGRLTNPYVAAGIGSVILSWAVVHTVFTARYARLYYTGPDGGIDFHQREPPRYADFAYVAFTVGVTFQVSDTNVTDSGIRATVLRHSLLSYLFGAVIIAAAINLIAGLAR